MSLFYGLAVDTVEEVSIFIPGQLIVESKTTGTNSVYLRILRKMNYLATPTPFPEKGSL